MTEQEQAYLLWFFQNADFGPADGDVRLLMEEEYTRKTGEQIPETLKYE